MDPALKRLLKQTVLALAAAMVILGVLGVVLREPAQHYSRMWVEFAGGWAILGAFTVLDAVPIPIPHDAFSAVGLLGGMGFWEVCGWASVGSLLGANGGYLIGRNLRHTAWFQKRMEQRGQEAKRFVETYGVLGLALGALTPLPFSICCQAAGALQMRYPRFALTILLRPPRVALYLWLVQVGFLQP